MRFRFYHLTLLLVFASTLDYRFFGNIAGVPSVTIIEIVSVALLLLLVMMMITRQPVSMSLIKGYKEEPLVFYYFAWSSSVAFIWLLNGNETSASHLKDILPSIVLFYMVVVFTRNRKDIHALLFVYFFGVSVHLFLGVSQAMLGEPRPVMFNKIVSFKTDIHGVFLDPEFIPTGLFFHPNGYALFLIPFAMLLISQIKNDRSNFRKTLSVIVLVFLFFVAWCTQVKGMFLWVFIGGMLLLLPFRFIRMRVILGYLVLSVGITLIMIISLWIYNDSGKLGTMQTRFGMLLAGGAVLINEPMVLFLGGGVDEMSKLSGVYSNMVNYPSSHNTYIDQAIVFGLPALLIYIAIAVKAMKASVFSAKVASKDARTIPLFLHSALIALLGAFFFEPTLSGTMLQAQFFFLCAMAAVIKRQSIRPLGSAH